MASNVRTLVEDVLTRDMTRAIWSSDYLKVMPVSFQTFDLADVLPAVFYMFRFGRRRGAGRFLNTFAENGGKTPSQRRKSATINRIADKLAGLDDLHGFDNEVERAVLGDLLLCFCLGNIRHEPGRDKQVQRAAPVHYMASWIDLPESVAHLRYVPEMLVAMLANRDTDDYVKPNRESDPTPFPVGVRYAENVLLRAFRQGVSQEGLLGDAASDRFDERDGAVGLDQLLMIRLAQQLGAAPDPLRGKDSGPISNQRPIAAQAAQDFSDDLRCFVGTYADTVPRHALVEMLESCVAVGLTTILSGTVDMLFRWTDSGRVPECREQRPTGLFVDCSTGVDRELRTLAEQSMDDLMRRIDRVPVILMVLRILDFQVRNSPFIEDSKMSSRPYATRFLNLLGDLLHDRHPKSQRVRDMVEEKAVSLAAKLGDDYAEASEILTRSGRDPIWRLAEGLMALTGPKFARGKLLNLIDSTLLVSRPNGLAMRRRTQRRSIGAAGPARRTRDVRSLVFTDPVLEYLTHRHLAPGAGGGHDVNLRSFMTFIRDRYGFHVAAAPTGMTISNDLLQRNRAVLERRLRDLGLLRGVNDADAMKRLRYRFKPSGQHAER